LRDTTDLAGLKAKEKLVKVAAASLTEKIATAIVALEEARTDAPHLNHQALRTELNKAVNQGGAAANITGADAREDAAEAD
jgi:hypothetical protein